MSPKSSNKDAHGIDQGKKVWENGCHLYRCRDPLGTAEQVSAVPNGQQLFDVAAEAVQDLQVVGAQHEVDDFCLGDVVGVADYVVLHQVFAKQLPGIGIADAEHGAELCDGYHIRIEAKALFVILSCHDRSPFLTVHVAQDARRCKADVFPTAEDPTR